MGQLAGVQVASYSRDEKLPTWHYSFAPGLNCTLIKQTEDWKDTGGRTLQEATQVVMGEPNPSFFQIPADTREATPTAYENQLLEAHAYKGMPPSLAHSMMKRDSGYFRSREDAAKAGLHLPDPIVR